MDYFTSKIRHSLKTGDTYSVFRTLSVMTENKTDFMHRYEFTRNISWAIPNHNVIDQLTKFFVDKGPILEVGSGFGLWTGLLKAYGLDVVATDPFLSHGLDDVASSQRSSKTYTDVVCMNHLKAIETYNTPCLFLCWPSCGGSFAAEALIAFQGKYLIYIGEGLGGCTANDEFFDILYNNWTKLEYISIPSWNAINDGLYIYVRNDPDLSSCCTCDRDDDSVCSDLSDA